MFGSIALFELRYQLRNPVFWVALVIFFLLTFGATASESIQIGGGGNVNVNSPAAIVQAQQILTLFFMFVTTAFVANVVVRDDESGFGPMVRSTRVTKFAYLMGRFSGAALAALVAFAAVPLAIFIGSLMPWVDPETVGPNRFDYYALSYLVFAVPNVILLSAIFFAVATMTRSMMYTYVAVVGFLVVYFSLVGIVGSEPDYRDTVALFEPLGRRGSERDALLDCGGIEHAIARLYGNYPVQPHIRSCSGSRSACRCFVAVQLCRSRHFFAQGAQARPQG